MDRAQALYFFITNSKCVRRFSVRSGLTNESVLGNDLFVPERAIFGNTPLCFVVHPDNAKALRVAEAPFEVVHKGPSEIAGQGHTAFNSSVGSGKMFAQIAQPPLIPHPSIPVGTVGIARTVFGDIHFARVVLKM